jgi:signal transduction histidine kinase/ligand-binding sensor domain-containing protein
MITAKTTFKALFPLLALLFILSCKNTFDNIPFPENETEFSQPVSKPITFSEPQKIEWITPNPDSAEPITQTKIDFDKLPTQPFERGGWEPFAKPVTETKIDWNSLPDTVFSLNHLPAKKLKFKTAVLGKPLLIKTETPHIKDSATTNLLIVDEGLPSLEIITMLRDHQGILWIGTTGGLCRFDGEYCSIYGREQGLQNTAITKLSEDSEGKIWISALGGVEVIDQKAGIIKQITTGEGLNNNSVSLLLIDRQGRMWIGGNDGGVDIIDEKEGTLKHFNDVNGLRANRVMCFLETGKGDIWIGTDEGVYIIDGKVGKMGHLDKAHGLSNNIVFAFCEKRGGEIWIATKDNDYRNGRIDVLLGQPGTIKHVNPRREGPDNSYNCLFRDRAGQMWIGGNGEGGVDIIDDKVEKVRHISAKEGLGDMNVWDITEDSQNHIWMATSAGLVVYDKRETIKYINAGHDLNNKQFYSLLEDRKGQIWADTDSGVYIINRKVNTIKYLKVGMRVRNLLEDSRGQIWMSTGGGLSVLNPDSGWMKRITTAPISSLGEDRQHKVWFATYGDGLHIIDEEEFGIKKLSTGQGFTKSASSSLIEDNKGQVWISIGGIGIDVIDQKRETFRRIINTKGLSENEVSFLEDSLHRLWTNTYLNGIDLIDQKAATVTKFSAKEGLANNLVNDLKTNGYQIFVHTTKGLTVLTPSGSNANAAKLWQVTTYGKTWGFISQNNDVFAILATKNGELWWGKNNRFTVMQMPEKDTALPNTWLTGIDFINQPHYFTDNRRFQWERQKEDTLWDLQKDSFYLKGQLPPDPAYLKRNNIRWDSVAGPYNIPVNLKLPYYQNYLAFHFTGTGSAHFDKTSYRYYLAGLDKRWSEISEKPMSESYVNLPPGDYTFKVCSRGFNGLWSQPAELSFTILPPWWRTWWAYAIYVSLIALCAWTFSLYRSRNLQRQNKLLEEKVNLRTKELNKSLNELKSTQTQLIQSEKMASLGELTAGIAHEIQNPLNFVNNFSDVNTELIDDLKSELLADNKEEAISIADDIKENEQKINHHGKRADAIVKGMLQHSRASTGKKELTDINALADEYLRLAYHGLRAKDKAFNADLITDFDEGIGKIEVVPQDIGRVLLNLFNNAFYAVNEKKRQLNGTFEPAVTVTTKRTGDKVEIVVKDNGAGIPQKVVDKIFQPFFTTKPTGQGTGLGLSLSYDIIQAHGGEIRVETKEGEGCEFTIEIRVKNYRLML